MSVLLNLLTLAERAALRSIAETCGDRFRPLYAARVSNTAARKLAKLGLVDIRKGDLDGARLVRLSKLAMTTLQSGEDPK